MCAGRGYEDMPFSLRTVDDLAEAQSISVADTKKYLAKRQVPIIGGYFDQGALDAVESEPKGTNIGKAAKNLFTLAGTDGVGAMKHTLDKVDLDIVRHLTRRGNLLTLRNKDKHRRQVKVYTTQRSTGSWSCSTFSMRGFLKTDGSQPDYYMFICFQGPVAYALSRKQLVALYRKVKKSAAASDMCRIPKALKDHPNGALSLYLSPDQESYLLTSSKQLGL